MARLCSASVLARQFLDKLRAIHCDGQKILGYMRQQTLVGELEVQN